VKILVLTRSTGEGHNRVAQAVRLIAQARGHDCQVMDAMVVAGQESTVETSAERGPGTSGWRARSADLANKIYGWVALKTPFAFGAVYALGEVYTRTPIPSPIYFQNAKWAEATQAYIEDHGYEVVVTTHLFPQETLAVVRRLFPSKVRYLAVLTDYTCIPFFSEAMMDGFMIPHPDLVRECVRGGIPRSRLYVTGMPVAPQFSQRLSKAEARAKLGLLDDVPVFLVMSGGVGSMRTGELCDGLLTVGGEDTQLVVLTGRREDLFRQIAGRYQADPRVKVVPFTDRVSDYMAAADVLLTKPGGASSAEAAVVGLPIIHTGAIPGNETKNTRFFTQHGMSIHLPRVDAAVRAAHDLINDEAAMERMKACQARNVIADSAERVIACIEGTVW